MDSPSRIPPGKHLPTPTSHKRKLQKTLGKQTSELSTKARQSLTEASLPDLTHVEGHIKKRTVTHTSSTSSNILQLGNKPVPKEAISTQIGRDFFEDRLKGPNIPGGKWLRRMRLLGKPINRPNLKIPSSEVQTHFKEASNLNEALLGECADLGKNCIQVEGNQKVFQQIIKKNKELGTLLNKTNKTKSDKEQIHKLQKEIKSLSNDIKIHIKTKEGKNVVEKIFSLSETLNNDASWSFYLLQQISIYASLGFSPLVVGAGGMAATSVIAIPISLFFLHQEYKKYKKSSALESKANLQLTQIAKRKELLKSQSKLNPTVYGLEEEEKLLRAMNKAVIHKNDKTGRKIALATRFTSIISITAFSFAGIITLLGTVGVSVAGIAAFSNPIGLILGTGLGLIAFTIFLLYFSSKTAMNYYEERKQFGLFKETTKIADELDILSSSSSKTFLNVKDLFSHSSGYYKKLFGELLDEYGLKEKFNNGNLSIEELKCLNKIIAYKAMRKLVRYNANFAAEVLQRMLYAESLYKESSERVFTNWLKELNIFKDEQTVQHIAAIDITNPVILDDTKKTAVNTLAKNVFNG